MPDDTRTLDDVLRGHRFAMVTTSTPRGLTARPLTIMGQEGPVLRFLVSTEAEWVQELGNPLASVQVSLAAPDKDEFASLHGHASLDQSREAVASIWNPAATAFFDGPDDPNAAVLEATIVDGEWWDGPSTKIGTAIAFVRKAVTGEEPGGHGRVDPGN